MIADCPAEASDMADGPARGVTVDAQKIIGTIRSLQGAHWDPGPGTQALSLNYVAMGVDMIRTHDAGGINGSGTGDIDGVGSARMFPNLNADATDAASYNFGPSDTMIKNIRDAGAEIYFRVGRSNIGGFDGNTVPPDFDKYAEIVKHVVMHYNQGWASGMSLGIRYFEIWNEPDFLPFWAGTGDQYHELYKKVSLAIRAVEENALIGGPANSTFNDKTGLRASFLQYVKDNQLPLDFYSFHKYTNKSNDPMDFARMAQSYRDELDMFGFTDTQIVNSEWESSLQGDPILGGAAGSATFTAEALMYMQDGPVDKSTSYMPINATANKESLAFSVISKLNATPSRLCAQGGDDNGFAVLAGLDAPSATLQVVIANYQIAASLMGPIPGGNEEELDIPGLGHLATMTYPERRSFTYPNKEGYALTIKAIPESWGDVTVKQYRIDADNDLDLVSTTMTKATERPEGTLMLSGAWARARANPPDDPMGAAQGVDLVVVTGTAAKSF
jgi:xylan 1,4-beta-xylosidase